MVRYLGPRGSPFLVLPRGFVRTLQRLGVVVLGNLRVSCRQLGEFVLCYQGGQVLFRLYVRVRHAMLLCFGLVLLRLLVHRLGPYPRFFRYVRAQIYYVCGDSIFRAVRLFLLVVSKGGIGRFFL